MTAFDLFWSAILVMLVGIIYDGCLRIKLWLQKQDWRLL
jgi:hypothetical protein